MDGERLARPTRKRAQLMNTWQAELESVALEWERSCRRASRARRRLAAAWAAHPDVLAVTDDSDRVLVALRVTDLHAWYVWRAALGIPPWRVVFLGGSCAGTGTLQGAGVRLVGVGVPGLVSEREAAAAYPYRMWDGVYDLALPMRDDRGNTWAHEGVWTQDGVPVLSLAASPLPLGEDAPRPCPLTDLVERSGPLIAVRPAGPPAGTAEPPAEGPESARAPEPADR
ncbi:BN159_2729 family protein [Actinacidiphila alni]|uniref:BN159_2729 family protein n=1 Tax=Actinacidiphila alni TaxID=380248 RepID=UPI0033E3DC38